MSEENFTEKNEELFKVWVRLKPFKKFNISSFLGSSEKVSGDMKSKLKFKVKGVKWSQSDFKKRENDYKAIFTSSCNKEILISYRKKPPIPFPKIFGENSSNKEIFKKIIKPRIKDAFEGTSFTLLTYGISGSGKTHTIFGCENSKYEKDQSGIIFHSIDEIFKLKKQSEKSESSSFSFDQENQEKIQEETNKKVTVSASFIEIYNENVYDLLSEDNSAGKVKEDRKNSYLGDGSTGQKKLSIIESPFTNGVIVPDLKVIEINSDDELQEIVKVVQEKRIVSPNINNHHSSRSHVIIELKIDVKSDNNERKVAKIRFVDLAGSEKVNLETKEIVQEGANINKSLLALTNCINILSSTKKPKTSSSAPYIPYRNSKLTRLLKDSLGGRTPVVMIVCLSPNSIYLEESLNSIKYAQKAKNIKMTYKREQLTSTGYLGVLSHFGNTETLDNLNSERTWIMRETYEKRIQKLEKECRYWRTLRERNLTERSHQYTERSRQALLPQDNLETALSDLPLDNVEEEFTELVQALIENVEDENLLKQNVLELDEMIRQNDHDINEVQRHIEDCKNNKLVCELYEELKFLADRLEENLDLKEEAIKEADMLKRTIECTKLALRKMFMQRIRQAKKARASKVKEDNSGVLRKRVQELSNKNAELTNALNSLIGEENIDDFLKERRGQRNREVFKEISHEDNICNSKGMKNAGVGEILNILMYKFKPKSSKTKTLVSPLEFTREMKSEGKTLIYSDSARDDFRTVTTRNNLKSGKLKEVENRKVYGNYIQSGRCTEDTNTNPMSLISSSSGRYISNDESKNSLI